MLRNPYCQLFDLRSGEIVEVHSEQAASVYLMTSDNLLKYRAGRNDYAAEGSMPFASPIELVARKAGHWYLVSERPLIGTYRIRLGLEARTGTLNLARNRYH